MLENRAGKKNILLICFGTQDFSYTFYTYPLGQLSKQPELNKYCPVLHEVQFFALTAHP